MVLHYYYLYAACIIKYHCILVCFIIIITGCDPFATKLIKFLLPTLVVLDNNWWAIINKSSGITI